ncbi:MAG: hypothetical protein ACXVHS_08630 [Methanobacterium sp.]
MPDFGEEYLKLTLEINKHLEGYVDSYFGPSDLKIKVENTPKIPINILNENLNDLHDLLPEDKERGAYLKKVLRAMENTLKILSGENLNFKGEIRAIYDIEPVLMRDKEIQKVRDTLNELLPGSNHQDDLNKRYIEWTEQFRVGGKKLSKATEVTFKEIRDRSKKLFEISKEDSVEIEMVRNQPWKAYNYYCGNAHSRIAICIDHPFYGFEIPRFLAHEIYPGHHLFLQLREKLLYKDKGQLEAAVCTLQSPMNVLAEGTANVASEIIFPEDSMYEWLHESLFPAINMDLNDYETFLEILKTVDLLQMPGLSFNILTNAVFKYYNNEMNLNEAIDYYCEYGLVPPKSAASLFEMVESPLFRSYMTIYSEGYRLINDYIGKDNKIERFKELLTQNMLPSWL